ncbi:hypothetical protein TW95_gp1725 [Pandoravirus inopinatum]|uniref:Uncharacterized protein n=1 Tax=Pandoravirus inopinatum TaxID=1605721 RepID=A0A0B5J4A3_9VIRU|nr:hypothetical protein TW95_gp1725 [Pandoravirus inopinatum]AJF98459.1 hypothetical protein [Pandoravirus inopinatum]
MREYARAIDHCCFLVRQVGERAPGDDACDVVIRIATYARVACLLAPSQTTCEIASSARVIGDGRIARHCSHPTDHDHCAVCDAVWRDAHDLPDVAFCIRDLAAEVNKCRHREERALPADGEAIPPAAIVWPLSSMSPPPRPRSHTLPSSSGGVTMGTLIKAAAAMPLAGSSLASTSPFMPTTVPTSGARRGGGERQHGMIIACEVALCVAAAWRTVGLAATKRAILARGLADDYEDVLSHGRILSGTLFSIRPHAQQGLARLVCVTEWPGPPSRHWIATSVGVDGDRGQAIAFVCRYLHTLGSRLADSRAAYARKHGDLFRGDDDDLDAHNFVLAAGAEKIAAGECMDSLLEVHQAEPAVAQSACIFGDGRIGRHCWHRTDGAPCIACDSVWHDARDLSETSLRVRDAAAECALADACSMISPTRYFISASTRSLLAALGHRVRLSGAQRPQACSVRMTVPKTLVAVAAK